MLRADFPKQLYGPRTTNDSYETSGVYQCILQVTGPIEVSLLDSLHPVKYRTEQDCTGQAGQGFVGFVKSIK